MSLRQVVLPEPDGPSMAKNSPSAISQSTSSTARTLPKWRDTPSKRTAVAMGGLNLCRAETGRGGLSSGPLRRSPSAKNRDVIRCPAVVGDAACRLAGTFSYRCSPEVDLVEIADPVG